MVLVPGPLHLQQLALVVFFIPLTSANTRSALVVVSYPLQLALVVFFLVALAHILHADIATCTVAAATVVAAAAAVVVVVYK